MTYTTTLYDYAFGLNGCDGVDQITGSNGAWDEKVLFDRPMTPERIEMVLHADILGRLLRCPDAEVPALMRLPELFDMGAAFFKEMARIHAEHHTRYIKARFQQPSTFLASMPVPFDERRAVCIDSFSMSGGRA